MYYIYLYIAKYHTEKSDNLKNSRVLTIKSKYYDVHSGGLKEVINSDELYKKQNF